MKIYTAIKMRSEKLNDPSLQSLCLDSIVKHFHRYFCAFTASKDARLKRNMEFLQRRFSNELACELLKDGKNTDLYFDFLINEHLTFVDFEWFDKSRYLECFDDILSRLPNLKKIRFSLYGDEILESVSKFCPRIIEIDAGKHNYVSDKGIQYLCEKKNGQLPCPELKKISVGACMISYEGGERFIQSVPTIEIFDWNSLPYLIHSIYKKKGPKRRKIPFLNLTKLNVFADEGISYISEVLKSCLSVCPKLESLLCEVVNRKEEIDAIMNSGLQLKELHLSFSEEISNVNLDNLLKACCHNLTVLAVYKGIISVSALAVHCPALQEFKAYHIEFTDDGNDLQLSFPALTYFVLTVETTGVAKAFSLIASSSPKLEEVAITGANSYDMHISFEMKNEILMWCKHSAAKRIIFHNVFIEMNFLKDIFSNFGSLTSMQIGFCRCDVADPSEIVHSLAKKHPNRPKIEMSCFTGF